MSARAELVARALKRAETPPTPPEWGYRIVLEEGDSFVGRYRGETVDEANEDRRVFLFWDDDGNLCFSRTYASLAREIDVVTPTLGCTIAVVRSKDYVGQQGTGYSFGIETEPNDDPLPDAGGTPTADDDIPF